MVIQPKFWLEEVLATPPQTRLLRLLANDPSKYWTGREAALAAQLPQSTANVALARIRSLDLLDIRKVGASHLFRLRDDLGINRHLIEIFEIESMSFKEILTRVKRIVPKEASCYLFGSTTSDGKIPQDVDLLVVAGRRADAEKIAGDLRRDLRDHSPLNLDVLSLSRREIARKEQKPLREQVLNKGRLIAGIPLAQVTM